jgi:hypothetical protein
MQQVVECFTDPIEIGGIYHYLTLNQFRLNNIEFHLVLQQQQRITIFLANCS